MKLHKTLSYYDYFNLTWTMFVSNPHLMLDIDWYWTVSIINRKSSNISLQQLWEVTITSIEVRLPSFNIGDTVMIVDTGEIGEIEDITLDDLVYVPVKYWYYYHKIYEIVKIPSDLIPLLQD